MWRMLVGQQDTKYGTFFFREKKLELRVAATGAADPEKEVVQKGKKRLKLMLHDNMIFSKENS